MSEFCDIYTLKLTKRFLFYVLFVCFSILFFLVTTIVSLSSIAMCAMNYSCNILCYTILYVYVNKDRMMMITTLICSLIILRDKLYMVLLIKAIKIKFLKNRNKSIRAMFKLTFHESVREHFKQQQILMVSGMYKFDTIQYYG